MKMLFLSTAVFISLISCSKVQSQDDVNLNQAKNKPNVTQSTPTFIDQDTQKRNNNILIKQHNISIENLLIDVNNAQYALSVYKKQPIGNIRYLVLHDNENAAFDSGLQAITKGGLMVVLENKESRYLYDQNSKRVTDIDPNRIFKDSHSHAKLAQNIIQTLNLGENNTIIALHNNNPNSNFRLKNIHQYGDTKIVCQHDPSDKNFYWIPYQDFSEIQSIFSKLCSIKKYNVVIEKVPTITNGDGSLSIYAQNKKWNYFNIEVKAAITNNEQSEQFAKDKQVQYINHLLSNLK